MKSIPSLLIAALVGLSAANLQAQLDISEVKFAGPGDSSQWIEIANFSANPVNLDTWSLYQATKTPGQPQNYWYGFPPGFTIPSGGFFRVYWNMDIIPANEDSQNIYTGTSIFNFLFGLGAEDLDPAKGALALLSTQDNALMNNASVFSDWFGWGDSGFLREDLAVTAGLWTAGSSVTAPNPLDDGSVALDQSLDSLPTPVTAFFFDSTPTPLLHNSSGAISLAYGSTCTSFPGATASLTSNSKPYHGNADFALILDSTEVSGDVLLAISVSDQTQDILFGCNMLISSPPVFILGLGFVTSGIPQETTLSLAGLAPDIPRIDIFCQAFINADPDFTLTNGLKLRLSDN